jgi:hypothetical protein
LLVISGEDGIIAGQNASQVSYSGYRAKKSGTELDVGLLARAQSGLLTNAFPVAYFVFQLPEALKEKTERTHIGTEQCGPYANHRLWLFLTFDAGPPVC